MFRFSIRDVLWLTVLAAVLAAWFVDRRNYLAKLDEARHDLRTLIYRQANTPTGFE
jgi:hypothetical protein